MDNTTPIEAISLNFTSNNKSALASFDEVISKLKKLQDNLPKVELRVSGGKNLKDLVTTANGLSEDGISKLSRLADALEKLSTVSIPHGIASSLRSINKAMNTTGVEGAEKAAEAISNMHDLSQTVKATFGQSTIQDSLPTALDSIVESGEKLTEIAPPVASLSEYFSNGSQAAYQMSSGIADLTKRMLELTTAPKLSLPAFSSASFGGLLPAISSYGSALNEIEREVETISSGTAKWITIPLESYLTGAGQAASILGEKLAESKNIMKALPSVSSADKMRSDYASRQFATENIQEATQQFAAMSGEVIKGRMAVYTLGNSIDDTTKRGEKLRAVFSGLGDFFRTGGGMLADVGKGFGGFMTKSRSIDNIATGMTPFGSLLGRGLKGIGKGMFMPLVKELQYVGKSAMGAAGRLGSFFGSIKRIATYRLIRMALKLISQGFKEGVTNLYEWSKAFDKTHEFAKSMDKIATAALYVKNSLGAMVAPIINALAPALDWLADKFVGLLNIVNEFFAALTGADTYTVAKKVATEFKEAADNTGKASKALKSYTIGIDELNIIEESKGTGSGGSGGSNVAQDWFNKKNVSTGMKDFVESLKDYFKSGDWKGLGTFLGTEFNKLVDKVPWESIGTKAGKLFTAGFTTLNSFLNTADFVKFGSKFGSMLNKFFEHADFSQAGEALVGALFSGVDFIGGFLGTVKWGTVTGKISDFFIGGMGKAKKWFESKDWKDIGKKIYKGVKEGLNGLKLADLIGGAWDLIKGVTKATIDVVVSFVGSWGEDIGNWFYDLSNGQLPDAGKQPLQFVIGGVGADIIEGLVFLAKNGYIDENLNITVKSIDQGMYNIGEKATPLAPGMLMSPDPGGESSFGLDMWKNFLTVVKKVREVLADIIEILVTPSDIAVQKWDAIKTGIKNIGDAGADAIENLKKFFERIETAFGDGNELGLIGVAVSYTKQQFESDMGDIKYWLDKGSKWFEGFGDDAAIAFGGIPTAFARHWTTLSGKLRYAKAKIELESMKLWNAVKSGFKTKANQFISILNSAIKGIFKALNKVAKGIDKMASSGALGMIGAGAISKIGSVFATAPQIPQLASGGVIDPNKPFLALLGDQRNGKNIEAPLETIKKALEDVIRDYDAESLSMPSISDVVNEVRRYADNSVKAKGDTDSMQRFYTDTILPIITNIANDTKRQADKNERVDVYMDSRKVTESVNKQNRANGYSFIK